MIQLKIVSREMEGLRKAGHHFQADLLAIVKGPSRLTVLGVKPFCVFTDQPTRRIAAKTFLAFELGQWLTRGQNLRSQAPIFALRSDLR